MEKRNGAIDLFRLFGAVMVIMIHTNMGIPIFYFLANTIGRYAVPIFMIITGFFFFKNPTLKRKKAILKNLFRLWVVWQIIYLPFGIFSLRDDSVLKIIGKFVLSLIGSSVSFSGSWYLIATIFGILFVDKMRNNNHIWICVCISTLTVFFDALMTNYGRLFFNEKVGNIIETINPAASVITGVLWITIAYFLVLRFNSLRTFGTLKNTTIAVSITFLEFWFVQSNNLFLRNNDMYLTLPLSVIVFYLFLLNLHLNIPQEQAVFIKNISTLIFFVHFGVLRILDKFLRESIWLFIMVTGISIGISILILHYSKIRKYNFLNKLF